MSENMHAALRRFERGMSLRQQSHEEHLHLEQENGDREMREWDKIENNAVDEPSIITTMLLCLTEKASYLCIQGLSSKLKHDSGEFDIGGTYNLYEDSDFWFFGNTSACHGGNYLLKLFVMTRNDDKFSLYLPRNGNNITDLEHNRELGYYKITGPTQEYMFQHPKVDQIHYVKTFRFSNEDLEILEDHSLLIPCSIELHTKVKIHPDILNRVRFEYTVKANEALYKRRNEGKFIIESDSHKQYPVHTFVAAAHSPVLMEVIKNNQHLFKLNLADEHVEMIVAFLYMGSVENVCKDDAYTLLKFGKIMGITGMLRLGEIALSKIINVNNAVKLAIVANSYNLQELLMKVYHYIKKHPMVLYSEDMDRLDDINLMRSMIRHVANSCSCEIKINY